MNWKGYLALAVFIYLFFNGELLNTVTNSVTTITGRVKKLAKIIGSVFLIYKMYKSFTEYNKPNSIEKRKNKRNVSQTLKKYVAASQKWKCAMCGDLLDETYQIDHIIPLKDDPNGTQNLNKVENLQALHASCHSKKTIMDELKGLF